MAAMYAFWTAVTSATMESYVTLVVVRRTGTDGVIFSVTCVTMPSRPTDDRTA